MVRMEVMDTESFGPFRLGTSPSEAAPSVSFPGVWSPGKEGAERMGGLAGHPQLSLGSRLLKLPVCYWLGQQLETAKTL